MVDIMKMENDPSVNLNNHEAKIAKEVATQFIAKRTGKMVKNQSLRRETQVMLRVAEESEAQRKASLLNLINNTMKISQITEENGLSLLLNISNQTFIDGISWGRIVSLHLFAALLAEQLRKIGKESVADKLGVWLGYCVAKRSTWIRENGNGWNGFIETVGGATEMENNVFTGLFNVTIGLGTFAAALYITAK